MRKIIVWYLGITTSLVLVYSVFVVVDILNASVSGSFSLLPSLNTARSADINEAFEYMTTLPGFGESVFMQSICVFVFEIGLSNFAFATVMRLYKLFSNKYVYIAVIATFVILSVLYFVYRLYISGTVGEPYIRKVILP